MKTKLLTALIGGLFAASLQATPIVNDNVRPVMVNGAPGSEASLQSILNGLFGPAWGNVHVNQSTAGQWGAATGSATTIPTLHWEATSNVDRQRFGMWFGTDSSNLLFVPLFWGAADDGGHGGGSGEGAPATAAIQITTGEIEIGSSSFGNCFGQVNCTWSPITDARISTSSFGFYFETLGGGFSPSRIEYANSIDNLSGYGAREQPRFLAFQQGGTSNWAFAYEDGTDYDYNDMVVKVESIQVPLPGTVALLGIGLLGAGVARRRRA